MSLFFTSLTNNSNLQKSAFEYFKATNVDMSHFRRNCILQQLIKDHKFISSNRGSCEEGGEIFYTFSQEKHMIPHEHRLESRKSHGTGSNDPMRLENCVLKKFIGTLKL